MIALGRLTLSTACLLVVALGCPHLSLAGVLPYRFAGAVGCLDVGVCNYSTGFDVERTIIQSFASPDGSTAEVEVRAMSTWGLGRVSASLDFNILDSAKTPWADANAQTLDILTIRSARWNGSPGQLKVLYSIDGAVRDSGLGQAFLGVGFSSGPATRLSDGSYDVPYDQAFEALYTASISDSFSAGTFTFTYGEPFYLGTVLGARAYAYPPIIGVGAADVDAFHTLRLSGLVPLDPSGDVALDAQFSSVSGTTYSINGVASVPEPNLLLLFGVALVGLGAWTRRGHLPSRRTWRGGW